MIEAVLFAVMSLPAPRLISFARIVPVKAPVCIGHIALFSQTIQYIMLHFMLILTGRFQKILSIPSAIPPRDNCSIGHFLAWCIKIATEDTRFTSQNSLGDYWGRKSLIDTGEQIKFDPWIQLLWERGDSLLMVERGNIHIIQVKISTGTIYSNEQRSSCPVLEQYIFVRCSGSFRPEQRGLCCRQSMKVKAAGDENAGRCMFSSLLKCVVGIR